MTLSHFPNISAARAAADELRDTWEPVEFTVGEIYLLEYRHDIGQWCSVWRVSLGSGDMGEEINRDNSDAARDSLETDSAAISSDMTHAELAGAAKAQVESVSSNAAVMEESRMIIDEENNIVIDRDSETGIGISSSGRIGADGANYDGRKCSGPTFKSAAAIYDDGLRFPLMPTVEEDWVKEVRPPPRWKSYKKQRRGRGSEEVEVVVESVVGVKMYR
jgi:hypothetical protein